MSVALNISIPNCNVYLPKQSSVQDLFDLKIGPNKIEYIMNE